MEAIPYFQSPLQRYSWYLSFFELTAHRADMHLNQWQAIIFMEKAQKAGSHGIVSIFMFEFW